MVVNIQDWKGPCNGGFFATCRKFFFDFGDERFSIATRTLAALRTLYAYMYPHPTDRFVSKLWFAPKLYGTCTIVPEDMELLRMFAVLRSKSETHAFLNHHIRKCSSSDDDVLTSRG